MNDMDKIGVGEMIVKQGEKRGHPFVIDARDCHKPGSDDWTVGHIDGLLGMTADGIPNPTRLVAERLAASFNACREIPIEQLRAGNLIVKEAK